MAAGNVRGRFLYDQWLQSSYETGEIRYVGRRMALSRAKIMFQGGGGSGGGGGKLLSMERRPPSLTSNDGAYSSSWAAFARSGTSNPNRKK
jgi:hypothetical protein